MANISEQTCSIEEPLEPIEQTDTRHHKGGMEMTFMNHIQWLILRTIPFIIIPNTVNLSIYVKYSLEPIEIVEGLKIPDWKNLNI